jgi:opacity protein-like surface antigen
MEEYIMRICVVMAAAALAMAASSVSAAQAAPARSASAEPASTGSCTTKKTEYTAADAFDESDSISFVNLTTSGSITFKQAKSGCVAGTFFANAGNTVDADNVVLQVLLDNTPCAPLTDTYFFANSGYDFSSHSAGFFCGANIAPGTHKIQVQYSSYLGGEVEFFQRSLVVNHS